jgi:hypothetical protein
MAQGDFSCPSKFAGEGARATRFRASPIIFGDGYGERH